jgi:hypothetical protein
VVDLDPAFSQRLLNVAVRQPEAQVPAGREDDNVWWEAEAREGRPCSGSGTEATRSHTSSLAPRTRDHRRRNSVSYWVSVGLLCSGATISDASAAASSLVRETPSRWPVVLVLIDHRDQLESGSRLPRHSPVAGP